MKADLRLQSMQSVHNINAPGTFPGRPGQCCIARSPAVIPIVGYFVTDNKYYYTLPAFCHFL